MPTAEIGRWEFYVPDGWVLKDSGIGISYLESPDGSMGMYSKTINSNSTQASALSFSEYIQNVHRGGFEADPQANWVVMESSGEQEGNLRRSRLDLWDEEANYPVLSLVMCSARHAVHLTLHDYGCQNHESSNADFVEIERSIRLAAGEA